MFATTKLEAIERYKHFVAQGKEVNIWQNLKSQIYLGDEEFVEKHKSATQSDVDVVLNDVPKKQVRPKAKPLSYYESTSLNIKLAMAQAYLSGGYSMIEIANYFGVHYSTISRAIAQSKS